MSLAKFYVTSHATSPYQVSFKSVTGQRIRRHFKDKKKALEYKQAIDDQLCIENVHHGIFDQRAQMEYITAKELLKGEKVSLPEVARFWLERNKILRMSWTNALYKFLDAKERANRSEKTLDDLKQRLRAFENFAKPQRLEDVTVEAIREWLGQSHFQPRTRAGYRISMNNFCKFAVREGWLKDNPVDRIDAPTLDVSNVDILTPSELVRLFIAGADIEDGRIMLRLAILALAGLRPGEVDRLEWSDIGQDHIRVGRGKLRGRRAVRIVPVSPTLRRCLDLYKGKDFVPSNWKKLILRAREDAKIYHWQPDILRHSWISYRLAEVKDEKQVAREAGNSPDVIYRHYWKLVNDDEAKCWGGFSML